MQPGWCTLIAVLLAMCPQLRIDAQPGYQARVVYEEQPAATTPPSAAVAGWLDRLASASQAVRREARAELLGLGPGILPELRWALAAERALAPSGDMREAGLRYAFPELVALIDRLEEPRRWTASEVTLGYVDASLADIVAGLGPQIDARRIWISSRPEATLEWLESAPNATLQIERATYWEALRAMRDRLSLGPSFGTGNGHRAGTLSFGQWVGGSDSPLDASRFTVAGPLLIAATDVAPGPSGGVTLALRAVAEPKVREASWAYARLRIDDVVDDRGRSLMTDAAVTSFDSIPTQSSGTGNWVWTIPVQLPTAPAGGAIAIRGNLSVAVAPPQFAAAIIDLTRDDRVFEHEGVSIAVHAIERVGARYVLSGELAAPAGSPLGRAMTEIDAEDPIAREIADVSLVIGLGLQDASQAQIRRQVVAGPYRREGERDIIGWTLTSYPGEPVGDPFALPTCSIECVPVALTWSQPNQTRWATVPFELLDVAVPPVAAQPVAAALLLEADDGVRGEIRWALSELGAR